MPMGRWPTRRPASALGSASTMTSASTRASVTARRGKFTRTACGYVDDRRCRPAPLPPLPERLRGPQHDAAWCDEIASWRYPEAWDMLMFGLRLGPDPRVVVTTTPKPIKIIRELVI